MLDFAKTVVRNLQAEWALTPEAKKERQRDRNGRPERDPGAAAVIEASIAWLAEAQDRSPSNDGNCSFSSGFCPRWI